ncbi:hypothetical protein QV08_01270 [Gallibacterium salpingitidis]|uniref:Portal protein n=1 Tax=Gallibacterium salpingitidis TaxID=505341 RepID=A0AB36E5F5_9PAST|nr:hypothetical protein [Gallibacterium salpingitidis]OBX09596.1 hypothetical protein QV08_01270 [Gallibacterium salpingitidis]OBX10451.1 hypothetical protein QV09_05825 [Gallibacterium salpingitidis]
MAEAKTLDGFGSELQGLLYEQMKQRQPITERWVSDMYQYRNQYESGTKANGSQVFVGYTRSKTDAWTAQMTDMLFPSDDKNYGIQPTPIPEIATLAKQQAETPDVIMARQLMQQAKESAEAMEKLIDDQLLECDYAAEARLCLHYAAVLGTGILRAPIVELKEKRYYQQTPNGEWQAQTESYIAPTAKAILPWDFVPDMSAPTLKDCLFVFERNAVTKRELQNLAKHPYYLKDNVLQLLESEASETHNSSSDLSSYNDTLRELSGLEKVVNDKRYELWTYHGNIPVSLIEQANQQLADSYKIELTEEQQQLEEINGVVVMSGNGKIISVNVSPLDLDDFPYSVYVCEPDAACLFGFGIPYLCRDAQEILNTAWRGMIDNGVLTIGDQVVVNKSVLEPADKDWNIKPNKVWTTTGGAGVAAQVEAQRAFGVFSFQSRQAEFANIIQMSKAFMDEESGLPMIAQGEQGQVTPTLGGMSMLMNAANAVRRRQVKEWDDSVTKPLIRRFYEYNMQFSDDPKVKGDMQIIARGTSALLVKETQTAQIIDLLDRFGQHPELSQAFDWYDGLRTLMQSMSMGAKNMLIPREEYEQKLQQMQQAQAQQPQDPAIMKAQMEMQLAQQKQQHELQIAQLKLESELKIEQMKVAIKEKELEIKLMEIQANQQHSQQKLQVDKELNQAKLTADLQLNTGKQAIEMQKFKTEVALKNQPTTNPTGNYGLEQ